MRHPYYDRQGNPIDRDRFVRLHADHSYKRVRRTTITSAANPEQTYDVSTVWLGTDHSFGDDGPPVIFETMVFADGDDEVDTHRYHTEEQARQGHSEVVTVVAATVDDPVVMEAEGC